MGHSLSRHRRGRRSSWWWSSSSSAASAVTAVIIAPNSNTNTNINNTHSNTFSSRPSYVFAANASNSSNLSRHRMTPRRPLVAPPPFFDHKSTKKIKSDVNVRKDTIRLVIDDEDVNSHLVSFTFDALVDCSVSILYFAKEGPNCTFTPLYPAIYMPRKIQFRRGLAQKFCQPPGTGADLGSFKLNALSKSSSKRGVFPLVILVETSLPASFSAGSAMDQSLPTTCSHAQITQAVLKKNKNGHFEVKVIRQILWIDGNRYVLGVIYGIDDCFEGGFDDSKPGKECVICMSKPKDTAILPCRHVCLCSKCAKSLRLKSNKCPVCRHRIKELIQIKIKSPSQFRGLLQEGCI